MRYGLFSWLKTIRFLLVINVCAVRYIVGSCLIDIRIFMLLFFFISGNTSSENYDVTLMICLLRNFSTIVPPSNGYDKMPPATEISDGADLARIKYYRNQIVHAEKDEIAKQDFTIAWACISKVNMSCTVLVK